MQKSKLPDKLLRETRGFDLATVQENYQEQKKAWPAILQDCARVAGWLSTNRWSKEDFQIEYLSIGDTTKSVKPKWPWQSWTMVREEGIKATDYFEGWFIGKHRENLKEDFNIIDGERRFPNRVKETRLALTSLKNLLILRSNPVGKEDKYPFGDFSDGRLMKIPAANVRSDHIQKDKDRIGSFITDNRDKYMRTTSYLPVAYQNSLVDIDNNGRLMNAYYNETGMALGILRKFVDGLK